MNDTEEPKELLTLAEAAIKLNVTLPRLRRLLALPEYAAYVQTVERRTRTGTRTAQVIPFPFPFPPEALNERKKAQKPSAKQEREREQNSDSVPVPVRPLNASELAVYTDRILQERERLITEQAARITDLVAALDNERDTNRRLLEALAREQALRALPAQERPADAQSATEAATPSHKRFWPIFRIFQRDRKE
jgi:hypothetical protein